MWRKQGLEAVPGLASGPKPLLQPVDVDMEEAEPPGGGAGDADCPAQPSNGNHAPVVEPVQPHDAANGHPPGPNGAAPPSEAPCAVDGPPQGDLTPVQRQAIADLEGIVARLSQIDAERWFQHPVSSADLPSYNLIVRQPMCFDVSASRRRPAAAPPPPPAA
jgi:hypothetical protein